MAIKNKADALKCLKDFGVVTETDGYKDMEARHEKIDREYNRTMWKGMKDRVAGRRHRGLGENTYERIFNHSSNVTPGTFIWDDKRMAFVKVSDRAVISDHCPFKKLC